MKLKEKISIDEFDGKRFQIRLVEPVPTNEKKAVITHYLHNIDNGVSKHFKKEALKYIKEYVQYQDTKDILISVSPSKSPSEKLYTSQRLSFFEFLRSLL